MGCDIWEGRKKSLNWLVKDGKSKGGRSFSSPRRNELTLQTYRRGGLPKSKAWQRVGGGNNSGAEIRRTRNRELEEKERLKQRKKTNKRRRKGFLPPERPTKPGSSETNRPVGSQGKTTVPTKRGERTSSHEEN